MGRATGFGRVGEGVAVSRAAVPLLLALVGVASASDFVADGGTVAVAAGVGVDGFRVDIAVGEPVLEALAVAEAVGLDDTVAAGV